MPPRILFLAPHPDDELVAATSSIVRARRAGAAVHVLYLTTGVPAPEQLWPWRNSSHAARVTARRSEALRVATDLELVPVGFSEWASRDLKSHLREALTWITQIMREQAIDTIWVPAWEGGHQDHDVANFLAARAADGRPVVEFAEYNRANGTDNWNSFAVPNGTETLRLLTEKEARAKRALLALYRSEKANLTGVKFEKESFRPLPAHDYASRPHPGPLSRERFHWVGRFVRHPRVDFDPTDRVIRTLAAFDADISDTPIRPMLQI
jgi:N-acetylglucosamine malate deacetylase 1